MPLTEKDISGSVARALREQLGMTQTAFWGAVGVKQSVGCRYEADMPIPLPVRILIVANYVADLRVNASTADSVHELKKLGQVQSSVRRAADVAEKLRGTLDEAAKQILDARKALARI